MCKKDVEKMEALKAFKHIALFIIDQFVSINQQQYGEWANVSFLIFKLVVY